MNAENSIPVRVRTRTDKIYTGKVHSFDNVIDSSSGTIRTRAFFENEDHNFLPGMFVTVEIGSPSEQNQILLSDKAISTNQDRKYVYVVDAGNTVGYREVTLGESLEGHRIIKSGLHVGDQVITEGLLQVRPGMEVVPQHSGSKT